MKVYIETLGCPKNFNDSQVARGTLLASGHEVVDNPSDADVLILNTCGFINDAKTESISRTFELAEFRAEGKKLIMSGCLSQRYHEDLVKEMPEVDLFMGVNEYENLPQILENLGADKNDFVTNRYATVLPRMVRKLDDGEYTSTLKIAEGCDNKCAYCVIPSIRGGFRSKAKEDVIAEAKFLAAHGTKELILIAQDVTNYGTDLYGKFALADLVREVCKVDGIEWVRLMYCYEDRITDELIEVMATEKKVCHYIDIPIQHASNSVLSAMKRRSTRKSIEGTINRLKSRIPDIAIRTTLIVGFPGETDEDFDELLDFVEETKFARLGVFAYSQEEGTVAGDMPNQIDEDVKAERLDQIMRTQLDISLENNRQFVGKTVRVLVDGIDEDGSYYGRTEYDAPEIDNSVLFTSKNTLKPGDFVNVEITDAFDYDLVGMEK